MNKEFDAVQPSVQPFGMSTPRQKQHQMMTKEVRALKLRGLTNQQVADKLSISKGLAHYYSKADKGDHVCPRCTRPFVK